MAFFIAVGVIQHRVFMVKSPDDQLLASILYILGTIGFAGSLVFYDALLPHVADDNEIDQVSSKAMPWAILAGLASIVQCHHDLFGPYFVTPYG